MTTAASERGRAGAGTATMEAMRLVEPGRFERAEVERPSPGPREALVRIEGCGVCGSNLDPWLGQAWQEYPLEAGAPGHEAWGVVEATGPAYAGPREGARVAILSERAFAEYDTVVASRMVELPGALDGRPVPAEPLACAMNVMERSRVRAGDAAAVVGVGYLGALLVQMADRAGATVVALSRREASRETAISMGAREAHGLDAAEDVAAALEGERGRRFDVVIEAAGAQAALDAASALVRARGRLVIAGYHQDGPRTVNMQLWNWRGIDVINAHERDPKRYARGMRRAVEAMARGTLEPDALHTHELPLSDLNEAMELLRDRPAGFVKAVVRPGTGGA